MPMQLVSSESGQSLQYISMDEVHPIRGGIFLPDFAGAIATRYRFQTFPERIQMPQAIKFEQGIISLDGIDIPITSLDIYTDGVSITASHTTDADTALTDFLRWACETYGFREPRTILPRRYQSRIIVDMPDSAGNVFFNTFDAINRIVSARLGSAQPLEVTQITIGPHPPTQYPFLQTWLLQARTGGPYVANRYFSAAPLSTEDHFNMLQEIEAIVSR
jgi:hypothetical protein